MLWRRPGRRDHPRGERRIAADGQARSEAAPRGAAFFDLDKTLIEGSSAIHFGRAAYRRGMVTRGRLARDAWANVRYRIGGSTDEENHQVRERILAAIAGQRVVDLARLGPEALGGILPALYPETLRAAYEHQDAGRPVYIVTAASHELAEMLARLLWFDGGIGTRSETRDGVYTGRPEGPFVYGEGKTEAIRRVAEQEGIDLSASYAYSDSVSDLPMLRLVGNPVAVNPDSGLEQVARAEGWRIMRFEKLGRRLRFAGAALALGLLGGGGGYAFARFKPRHAWRRRIGLG